MVLDVDNENHHPKQDGLFPTIFGLRRAPSSRKPFQPKKGIPYYLYTVARGISDGFRLRKPRHSDTILAKKRYTLIPLYRSTWHFRRFWVKEPRHPENHFSQKKVYLDTSVVACVGMDSSCT